MVLEKIDDQVFAEVGEDYLLYICEAETLTRLTSEQIVLLVDTTVQEHMKEIYVH